MSDGHFHYRCITTHRLDISTFPAPESARVPASVCVCGGMERGCSAMGISLIRVSNECGAVGICKHSSP